MFSASFRAASLARFSLRTVPLSLRPLRAFSVAGAGATEAPAAAAGSKGRLSGTVKWFKSDKGYGFITMENGQDCFVHYTSINARGYRTLTDGQRVEFSLVEEPKGKVAKEVSVLPEAPPI